MSIILLIAGAILLSILYMIIACGIMVQPDAPPKPVRVAGITEAAFGTLVFFSGAFLSDTEDKFWIAFFMLFGIFWISIAASLYKASKVGRAICLILSIIRVPTVIGLFFSLLSIYKLYFTQESRDFFNKAKPLNMNTNNQ